MEWVLDKAELMYLRFLFRISLEVDPDPDPDASKTGVFFGVVAVLAAKSPAFGFFRPLLLRCFHSCKRSSMDKCDISMSIG